MSESKAIVDVLDWIIRRCAIDPMNNGGILTIEDIRNYATANRAAFLAAPAQDAVTQKAALVDWITEHVCRIWHPTPPEAGAEGYWEMRFIGEYDPVFVCNLDAEDFLYEILERYDAIEGKP